MTSPLPASPSEPQNDEDEKYELQLQLTSTATERVTWEAARDIANARASGHYIGFREDVARLFRDLGADFEQRRKAASDKQADLLKQLGVP